MYTVLTEGTLLIKVSIGTIKRIKYLLSDMQDCCEVTGVDIGLLEEDKTPECDESDEFLSYFLPFKSREDIDRVDVFISRMKEVGYDISYSIIETDEFGLLGIDADGHWTINNEVVESAERVRIEAYFFFKDAHESKMNHLRNFDCYSELPLSRAYMLESGVVMFNLVSHDNYNGTNGPEPDEFYAFRAKRLNR